MSKPCWFHYHKDNYNIKYYTARPAIVLYTNMDKRTFQQNCMSWGSPQKGSRGQFNSHIRHSHSSASVQPSKNEILCLLTAVTVRKSLSISSKLTNKIVYVFFLFSALVTCLIDRWRLTCSPTNFSNVKFISL